MKYKFCSIRINVTKNNVTFVTSGDSNLQQPSSPLVVTPLLCAFCSESSLIQISTESLANLFNNLLSNLTPTLPQSSN